MAAFVFDNSYARELPGFYVDWHPERVPQPRLVFLNDALAAKLGLDLAEGSGACHRVMITKVGGLCRGSLAGRWPEPLAAVAQPGAMRLGRRDRSRGTRSGSVG
jgi:hypothetical protein